MIYNLKGGKLVNDNVKILNIVLVYSLGLSPYVTTSHVGSKVDN